MAEKHAAAKKMPAKKPKPVRKGGKRYFDYSLIFAVVFLTAFGLLMVFSASSYSSAISSDTQDSTLYLVKQARYAVFGFIVMFLVSRIDYHFYLKFAWIGYWISFGLMILVSVIGKEINGKRRWFNIGGMSIQPAEIAKIGMILFLSVYIVKMGKGIHTFKGLVKVFAWDALVAAAVAYNNLSSGIIVGSLVFVMSFVATRKFSFHLLLGGLAGLFIMFVGPMTELLLKIHLLKPYQAVRIEVWQHPELYPQDGGFQVLQSLYAVGSGGIMGKGLGESIQKLGHIPEPQNDMIFAIICEELGLFGAVSLILVYLFVIYRLVIIAVSVEDRYGALFTIGVMAHIAVQVILNIAVATNAIPNTGISLPFVSAGGTSLVFLMIEMGIVLNISRSIRMDA